MYQMVGRQGTYRSSAIHDDWQGKGAYHDTGGQEICPFFTRVALTTETTVVRYVS